MAVDKARRAAVAALVRMRGGGYSNLGFKEVLAGAGLDARERAFAAALFYGTAERLVTLDAMLAPFSKKPLARLDVEVRAILESGLYQMAFMDRPPRAVVDESVKLARAFGKSSAAGFANAVLRRAAGVSLPAGPFESEQRRVELTYSLSPAVAKAVMAALPEEYEAYLESSFGRRELCLRVNTFKTTVEELEGTLAAGGVATRRGGLPGCLYAESGGLLLGGEWFEKGLYLVQGEASQYAVACLAPRSGQRLLDLCAAPGGKSATAAMLLGAKPGQRPGAGLTACDLRQGRVELTRRTMKRLALSGAASAK